MTLTKNKIKVRAVQYEKEPGAQTSLVQKHTRTRAYYA
jgi:hypothetical protein